jgi:hypothetical protein
VTPRRKHRLMVLLEAVVGLGLLMLFAFAFGADDPGEALLALAPIALLGAAAYLFEYRPHFDRQDR